MMMVASEWRPPEAMGAGADDCVVGSERRVI